MIGDVLLYGGPPGRVAPIDREKEAQRCAETNV
jgi:hypothetical protein